MMARCVQQVSVLTRSVSAHRLDDTIRAARHIGIRFHPVRGAMSRGVSKGGIPPDELVEQEPDILADMRRCIAEYHDNSRCRRACFVVGPCRDSHHCVVTCDVKCRRVFSRMYVRH